jgi:hypothetical protein
MASDRCAGCGQAIPPLTVEEAIVVSSPCRTVVPIGRLRAPALRLFEVRFAARRPAQVYVYDDEPYSHVKQLAMIAWELPLDREHRFELRDKDVALASTIVPRSYYVPVLTLAWLGPES